VVAVAPVLLRLHDRHGLGVVAALAALATATDALATVAPVVGWANLAWVWLALHQLGIAWQAGALRRPGALLAGGAVAVALLIAISRGAAPRGATSPASAGTGRAPCRGTRPAARLNLPPPPVQRRQLGEPFAVWSHDDAAAVVGTVLARDPAGRRVHLTSSLVKTSLVARGEP